MADFTHLNERGEAQMVDVSAKPSTYRIASFHGQVRVSDDCVQQLNHEAIREISSVARAAGMLAAKKTSDLIPHCHQISLTKAEIEIHFDEARAAFMIHVLTKSKGETGVEMEALIGAQIAASTIYDMIKAIDPHAELGPFQLVHKEGGKTPLIAPNINPS